MYPILCPGGYGVPWKLGKFEIVHIEAPGSDTNASSRLTFLDDTEAMVTTKVSKHRLIYDQKRVAACHANIGGELKEPIKIRNGLSLLNSTNLEPGHIFVYVR